MNDISPLLTIRCLAYNHEHYIRQCLDGFVMQQTDFKFEVIVHDDASTDGTANIIREYAEKYPDIIKPILQTENQYSKHDGSLRRIVNEHTRGKYVAFCEGDDYWTDPLKIQKQVGFLEANPEYGLVYTEAKSFIQNDRNFSLNNLGVGTDSFEKLLYNGNGVPTLTTCFRTHLLFDYYEYVDGHSDKWLLGDYPLWLFISLKMKLKFLNEVTAVYRVLTNSASHSEDVNVKLKFEKSVADVLTFFCDKNNITNKTFIEETYLIYSISLKVKNRLKYRKDIISYLKLKNRVGRKQFKRSFIYIISLINPVILRWSDKRRSLRKNK